MRLHLALGLLSATALVGCSGAQEAPSAAVAQEDCSGGYVTLSYDDGPTDYTWELAHDLEEAGLTATFFMLGQQVARNPVLAEYVAARHQIGNHSYNNPDLIELGEKGRRREIFDTTAIIEEHTGQRPEFFRPPYGETDADIRTEVEAQGMTETLWTLDTVDWQGKTAGEIVAVVAEATDGDIIVMHDDDASDVEAVPLIAEVLAEKSLCTAPLRASDTPVEAWEDLSFNAEVARP